MRTLVAFLFRKRLPLLLPIAAAAAAFLLFVASLLSLGMLQSVDYDDEQNARFDEAMQAQLPPAAIKAASLDAGTAFATATRLKLTTSANELLRSEDAAQSFAESRPEDPKARAWNDEYLCGLKGWGVHRAVIRRLVLSGYGECGPIDRFRAKAPALYRFGGWRGWLLSFIWPILLIALIAGAALLAIVRKAYFWLYESRMRN